jgi:hypothetical protein
MMVSESPSLPGAGCTSCNWTPDTARLGREPQGSGRRPERRCRVVWAAPRPPRPSDPVAAPRILGIIGSGPWGSGRPIPGEMTPILGGLEAPNLSRGGQTMIGSKRRATAAILGAAITFVVVGGQSTSRGQEVYRALSSDMYRGLSYEEDLLEQLDASRIARPADLPKLAQLVLLETISMRQYARRELGGSPAGATLLNQIDTLWQAASEFDQVAAGMEPSRPATGVPRQALAGDQLVPWAETSRPTADALQESFANLETAATQVRSNLGALPGGARLAWYRLERVASLLAEIRPRLPSTAPARAPASATVNAGGLLPEIRQEARLLTRQLVDLLGVLRPSDPRSSHSAGGLTEGVGHLLALAQGFDRLLSGRPTFEDIRDVFRPVRLQAMQVNALVLNRVPPVEVRTRWREIQDRIDRLSSRFGFPRLIVLRSSSPTAQSPPRDAIPEIDRAVSEIDAFLAEIADAPVARPNQARVEDGAQRLRTLLLRFRQDLVAGAPRERIAPSLRALEGASRQLAELVPPRGDGRQDRGGARIRGVERIVSELGREPGTR